MTLLLVVNLGLAWGTGAAPAPGTNKTPATPRVAGAMKARG